MAGKQKPVQVQEPVPLRLTCAFARRMHATPKSFIREILKVTENPDIISLPGGLPNPDLIDVRGIAQAATDVLRDDGRAALRYATTEGYPPLRQYITTISRTGWVSMFRPKRSSSPTVRSSVLISSARSW